MTRPVNVYIDTMTLEEAKEALRQIKQHQLVLIDGNDMYDYGWYSSYHLPHKLREEVRLNRFSKTTLIE